VRTLPAPAGPITRTPNLDMLGDGGWTGAASASSAVDKAH
jgi:hypothetical protein